MRMKRNFTREELYDLVWSKPISKLATEFGLSDRGLSKICERHHIPVPGRGHWARVDAGLPAKKTPLWKLNSPAIQTVHISASPPKIQSTYLADILAEAKSAEKSDDPTPALLSEPASPTQLAAPVVDPPTKMHPEISSFLGKMQKIKPDRNGFVDFKYVKVPPSAFDRVGKLLNRLLANLQPYGFRLLEGTGRLGFGKDGSSVDFAINAPRKRIVSPSRSGHWSVQEYEHVGRLELRIFGRAEGSKKDWSDTESRKIEEALPQVIDSFLINQVAEERWEKDRRINEERRAQLLHRRELAAHRIKREQDRLEFLHWIAKARREVEDLRITVGLVPTEQNLQPEYQRMIAWATDRLSMLEEVTSVERIQQALVEKKLYEDPDPLYDPEGVPPPKVNYWDD